MIRPEHRNVPYVAATSFALTLAMRCFWIFRVQSPYDAVYSDMGGYVNRAKALLAHTPNSFPRIDALYPYGTHFFYAGLFKLLGYDHHRIVCIAQAILCAIPAYFFVRFSARFFTGAWIPLLLGVIFAVWQPLMWCAGFFVSEVPFIALLYWNLWLALRYVETRRGGFFLGATAAVLFAIRPQFILTFAVLALAYLWSHRRRLFARGAILSYAWILLPWAVVLSFSIERHHRLTGRWGLISENGNLNSVFADTTVGKVEASWKTENGGNWYFMVEPPTKKHVGEREVVKITGYLGDPAVLAPIKASHLEGKSVFWRVRRAFGNVTLLWDLHGPWPEDERAKDGWRKLLQYRFAAGVARILLPLAAIGLLLLRKRTPIVIILAHVVTLVVLSLFFFPEARYRVPYDPLFLLVAFAVVGRVIRFFDGMPFWRRLERKIGLKRPKSPEDVVAGEIPR